jgi:hypothetical protein
MPKQSERSNWSDRLQALQRAIFVALLSLAIPVAPMLIVGGIAGSAFAQAVDIPAILSADLKGPPSFVNFQYGHQFKTSVNDGGADMSRDNAFLMGGHRFALGENTSLIAIGGYTLHAYNFRGNSNSFYQWDDVHRMVLGAMIGHELNDRWRLIGGVIYRSWGEGGADYGKSITGGFIAGFDYHPDENYSVGLMLGAFTQLESGLGIIPIPTMKWQFADNWRWNIGMVSVFDPGVGTEVTWQINEDVSLGTGITFQTRRFRLNDKNRANGAPSRPNRNDDGGVGQETEVPVFVALKWKPSPKTNVDLLAGVAFAGNVRVESDAGGRIKDDDYDAAPFVGLKAGFLF